MPFSTTRFFSEPDEYAAAIRADHADITVTGRGPFNAGLVDIDLDGLWLQRFSETLPRVARAAFARGQAVISFRTQAGPPLLWAGADMQPDCLTRHCEGDEAFQLSAGPACWATIALPAGAAIAELAPPPQTLTVTPTAAAMARLQRLHAAAAKLATAAPKTLAEPELARSMKQSLVEAMAGCLAEAEGRTNKLALQHQALIMRRFYRTLETHRDQPVYIPELCAEIGVSERTLRACCQQQLGIGPHRYLLLRRMHLARSALLRSAPATTTVTEIAARHGFWQFGRFARDYRHLFGELPSATLAQFPRAIG
jgi:AraC-like DNA-binding protein